MGFVEILYKDHSGIRIDGGKMEDMSWDYCGVCREITDTKFGSSSDFGIFICYECLRTKNVEPA